MKAFYETRDERVYIGEMTRYPYPLHVHEIVEVVRVRRGTCDIQLDGRAYTLEPGDLAIAFPLVPHSYERLSPDIDGFAAYFPASLIGEFAGAFETTLPSNPVLRGEQVNADARTAIERLSAMPEGEYCPSRQAYLHLLLANVLSAMVLRPTDALSERDTAARVVRYISEHACDRLTLSVAARDLGISESHISHLFSQRFHINFRQFINTIRVDKAIIWMRDPRMTLTTICDRCGYDNMRTFRRAFLRETGKLPHAYMKAAREGKITGVPTGAPLEMDKFIIQ